MKNKKNIINIHTVSYPYLKGGEKSFIGIELEYLSNNFEKIVLIPHYIGGEKDSISYENVFVDESLAKIFRYRKADLSFLNLNNIKIIINEFFRNSYIIFKPKKIRNLVANIAKMDIVDHWWKEKANEPTMIYSYWFTFITTYFSFIKKKPFKLITRVHGIDLYEERNNDYIPLRKKSISQLDKVYCASNAGLNYLKKMYPDYSYKYKLARLGVRKSELTIEKINIEERRIEKKITIVSCSGLIKLKRVDLIVEGLIQYCIMNPAITVNYTHIGDGPERSIIENLFKINKTSNLQINLKGDLSNQKVIDYYKKNKVDLFLHMSSTEGGCPVAIQEAQSFGIPIIAAANGGVIEMIDYKTGILLPSSPTKKDIVNALNYYLNKSDEEKKEYKQNSFRNFEKNFNADNNFKNFIRELKK